MFEFGRSPLTVSEDLADVARRTWDQIAAPGTWWTGPDRVAIARTARAARIGEAVPDEDLPDAAVDVAAMLGATPAYTSASWAAEKIERLGEARYVEVASVASRVVAIDTFTRLMGGSLEPLPEPGAGEPDRTAADPPARRSRAWVAMVGFPNPPNAFSLVPAEAAAMVDITDHYYMPEPDMQYADQTRHGLHRTQMETVAGVTSHSNECFY